ncbi:hypothetical protein [uncultured Shimia sp.]|uniref:EF-hand domain-containing protein n=1 Tax=uncultured Shimia sp. TaxID=573152 RepID=UPI002604BF1F|nr:hypothetical protein [uncultured Shimia sp.]
MKIIITLPALLLASIAIAAPDDIRISDWDTNGDGLLSREEAAAIQYDAFDYFDLDEDGDLKGSEREDFEADLAFRQSQNHDTAMVAAPDANGDGLISAGEFKAWTGRMFDQVDKNGDGLISKDEMQAHQP